MGKTDWRSRRRVMTVTSINPETQEMFYLLPENNDPPAWFPEPENPKVFAPDKDDLPSSGAYEDMKVKDLLRIANDRGIELFSTKKADIVDALKNSDDADNS